MSEFDRAVKELSLGNYNEGMVICSSFWQESFEQDGI